LNVIIVDNVVDERIQVQTQSDEKLRTTMENDVLEIDNMRGVLYAEYGVNGSPALLMKSIIDETYDCLGILLLKYFGAYL